MTGFVAEAATAEIAAEATGFVAGAGDRPAACSVAPAEALPECSAAVAVVLPECSAVAVEVLPAEVSAARPLACSVDPAADPRTS